MKKKLFFITLICLSVIYCGWLGYNQIFPKVIPTHARYIYHYENESQMAEQANAVIKVKALGKSRNFTQCSSSNEPYFGYTISKVEIMKVYKSTELKEKQVIDFIEPYFTYSQPIIGKKYLIPIENYKPLVKGKQYILYIHKFTGKDPNRVGAYEPIQCEYGKYRINEKFDESIDTSSLTVDDYDIYEHNSDYEKLFREVMKKYK